MSRLLVIEIAGGVIQGVATDTGEDLDLSVAIVDHDESHIYRAFDAQNGGAEEIIALVKSDCCVDGMGCGAHGYTDDDDDKEES
jgi:hypothetical protein